MTDLLYYTGYGLILAALMTWAAVTRTGSALFGSGSWVNPPPPFTQR